MNEKHQSNRRAWNEAASHYRTKLEEDVERLRKGWKNFHPPELPVLQKLVNPVTHCIHLQCAGGTDTLSFINLGARKVTGVDISEEMISVAHEKSKKLGMNADWIVSDVLETPSALNGTADLVYTGRGAINWIMDSGAWATVVARLLKPGGHFYIFEGHPATLLFQTEPSALTLDPGFAGYFSGKIYESKDWPATYVGKIKESVEDQTTKYERTWPISSVINSLLDTGLLLEHFGEYPDAFWTEFPNLPEDLRMKFPNTFSLLMRKPSH